ncbi:CACTA en-spm transposon protein [Cucumis melo var. makuwa]|uniref:CACTA en-spm transposon protein n=1 Tax=Cucumis melo var. makuwa TaxID=1194695 RepID=A0A5A7U2N3_CUCMM|nr:CACTA en-spm transposon protein [Cucumis melo var. makuwa]
MHNASGIRGFLDAIRFSQAIGMCVRKTFPVRYLKWVDVGRKYIEVVKCDLQQFFVLDFNDQAMNRFVEHQMLMTFKEFQTDCHRHFKKYSDPEEARANPPNTSNRERTRMLDRSSLTIIVAGPSRFYNDSRRGFACKSLQETGVLPTLKNVSENKKYIEKGYANVYHGVGTNVGRTESGEAFPMPCEYNVGNASPDA